MAKLTATRLTSTERPIKWLPSCGVLGPGFTRLWQVFDMPTKYRGRRAVEEASTSALFTSVKTRNVKKVWLQPQELLLNQFSGSLLTCWLSRCTCGSNQTVAGLLILALSHLSNQVRCTRKRGRKLSAEWHRLNMCVFVHQRVLKDPIDVVKPSRPSSTFGPVACRQALRKRGVTIHLMSHTQTVQLPVRVLPESLHLLDKETNVTSL
ncbi:uncharacterized protein LOC109506792 isoform X1 [Hippocampus comes]|uniref:uncharacterized protein LOC109506792 isoform X1 n=1 Tax=Hippocampus comes TaxID=109280 RepID=UPI00094E93FF|nr:PREDICTED: uncharacterized protein LOC109506792 isoform X1 [Hippocampus comes]